MGDELSNLLMMKDLLLRLSGKIGETRLRKHLQETPVFAGGPTHRRWGKKIVFSGDDIERLLKSLECPSKLSVAPAANTFTSVEPSAEKAYLRAQALLTKSKPKHTGQNARRSFGRQEFTAHELS